MSNAWAQCSWSIHAIRLLRRGAYQYAHSSSVCEIPDALMHAGICLSDARSCYCWRNINRRVGLRLLCFALQVLVKPRQHTLTHSCWDRCGNAGMCACWVTSGRRVCVRVSWLWVFSSFFLHRGSKSGRTCAGCAASQQFRKDKNTAVCRWGRFRRKGGWKTQSDRDHSHTLTHIHTHRKEMSHQWVCERALRGSNCIWWEI